MAKINKTSQSRNIAKKMAVATNNTNKSEKRLINDMKRVYRQSLKEINQKLDKFVVKYGIDGKLSQADSYKYNRLIRLQKEINEELSNLTKTVNKLSDNHLIDVDIENYDRMAYSIETEGQFKVGYPALNKKDVRAALHTPLDKVAIANNKRQVIDNIRRDLAVSIAQGEGRKQAAKRIQKSLETNANNALRITQTEQTRIMNDSRFKAMKKAEAKGLEIQKVWLATLDDRTRSSHENLDGQKRDIDKPYSNGLMYPGDPSGSAAEVINCRCTQTTEIDDYPTEASERRAGDGNVIPYKTFNEWKENRPNG